MDNKQKLASRKLWFGIGLISLGVVAMFTGFAEEYKSLSQTFMGIYGLYVGTNVAGKFAKPKQ